jgi:hypothetical protein
MSLLFKNLDTEEEREFRNYARENDPPDMASWDMYHPICREEWTSRGIGPVAPGER